SLAVAAVPEGLAAVVTIVLALGVQRLVAVGTIVKRLPSVETLGAVSVVCSDKTGTLTQNRMTVTEYWPDKSEELVRGMMLCNDASTEGGARYGDPTELALLDMGVPLTRPQLEKDYPRIDELPFDSERKRMTTLHRDGDCTVAYTKGSIEGILDNCVDMPRARRVEIERAAAAMSSKALRVLALAKRCGCDKPVEEDLEFVGLVGMIDPPRPEAAAAVASFKQAGVRTVMITGDHPDTAFAIAKELGIAEDASQCMTGAELDLISDEELAARIEKLRVFARVSPMHKVKIVDALRAKGHIVSMTGDGVNDAPSLKMADIGVSMGITGTDVARSASDMVLSDDNFATIERAISEGRGIYSNIKKSVLFLLSSNFGEIITMTAAIAAGLAAPLRAIHILWVNLITDSLPGLALGVDRHDNTALMRRPPRDPAESLFAGGGLFTTIFYGVLVASCTLYAFMQGLEVSTATGQTFAFTVLGISQLFHAVGMRDVTKSIFRMSHTSNPLMLFSFVIGLVLQIAVTEVPFLIDMFGTVQLSPEQWLRLCALSAVPLAAHELLLTVQRRYQQKTAVAHKNI
ncbi:MAG TPA: cation-translocating P-type ATPase, partial [Terriglobales bacterium]|nr:cation-translocating P-type ATPase [Terriglobales bacterium]